MTENSKEFRRELERIRRVSDLLSTAHSILNGKYNRYSLFLSLAIIVLSAWLSAVALANPKYLVMLTPFGIEAELWIGLLAIFTFCLSLTELKVDWRGLAEAHKTSLIMYVETKREAANLLTTTEDISVREFQKLTARYDLAAAAGTNIPHKKFLKLKQMHKQKIEISKILDDSPASSVTLIRIRLFFRDNWPFKK